MDHLFGLAKQSLAAGKALVKDDNGNEYLAYIVYMRCGYKYVLFYKDADLVDLQGSAREAFLASEISTYYDYVYG